ncbi:hypothetical protein ANN_23613 [Periplaneta americana]|uniref:Uncharacterized protein n=1 Tax=Periplaneta americana TaxID=6978 RepID=A0ABQ8SLL0_PERAM|nr:hypothetical protein ANN_23613 [Periplaneta americana]
MIGSSAVYSQSAVPTPSSSTSQPSTTQPDSAEEGDDEEIIFFSAYKVVQSFDPDDAVAIQICQELLNDRTIEKEVIDIKPNFGYLPDAIIQLEKSGVELVEQINIMRTIVNKLSAVEEALLHELQLRISWLEQRTTSLVTSSVSIVYIVSGVTAREFVLFTNTGYLKSVYQDSVDLLRKMDDCKTVTISTGQICENSSRSAEQNSQFSIHNSLALASSTSLFKFTAHRTQILPLRRLRLATAIVTDSLKFTARRTQILRIRRASPLSKTRLEG